MSVLCVNPQGSSAASTIKSLPANQLESPETSGETVRWLSREKCCRGSLVIRLWAPEFTAKGETWPLKAVLQPIAVFHGTVSGTGTPTNTPHITHVNSIKFWGQWLLLPFHLRPLTVLACPHLKLFSPWLLFQTRLSPHRELWHAVTETWGPHW